MALLAGFISITLMFVFLLEIRKRVGIYAKNCLPLCTDCIWFFVILPLAVGAPAAVVYLGNSTANYRYLSGMIISFVSILLMVGVSVGSIVLNYVFKQMEQENKAKDCVAYMGKQLTKIAVRGGEDVLRTVYDQHQLNGENVVSEMLMKGSLVFWWEVHRKDPDIRHNRVLIYSEQYRELRDIEEKTNRKANDIPVERIEKKEEKKDVKLCCTFCYESDEEEEEGKAGQIYVNRRKNVSRKQAGG